VLRRIQEEAQREFEFRIKQSKLLRQAKANRFRAKWAKSDMDAHPIVRRIL